MTNPTPQLLQIKKYPNRRLYDQTRSCHLTHDELYDLVVQGHTVVVTESATGQDITNVVLMQALLDRTPVKLAAVPPELLHLIIRASDSMLHSFFARYFEQLWATFAAMQRPFTPPTPATNPFNPFAAWMPQPPTPSSTPAQGSGGGSEAENPPVPDQHLLSQLAKLSAEVAALNQRLNQKPN